MVASPLGFVGSPTVVAGGFVGSPTVVAGGFVGSPTVVAGGFVDEVGPGGLLVKTIKLSG